MPKTWGGESRGLRRQRRLAAGLAGLVALTLLTGCTAGRVPTPPPASGGAAQAGASAPPLPVTAMIGKDLLPQGTPGMGKPPLTIGSKDFPEQTLLGELYTQALVAKGYTVTLKANIGGSELIDTSLSSNQIQMYPEYLGEIVTSVADQPPPISAADTYDKAKRFEEQQRGATILKQTPFQDTDAVVVTTQTARQYGLTTITDLNKIRPGGAGVKIAGQSVFSTRQTGLLGVQQQYNLPQLGFVPTQPGQQYRALDSGTAQAADAFTTDAALQSGKYKLLTDPKNIFGYQYVAPVINQDILAQEGPDFEATCNWVSSLLTNRSIQALNGEVQGTGADAADIAQQILIANGLK